MLLIVVNETHLLKIPEHKITWDVIVQEARTKQIWSPHLEKLKMVYASYWYNEVRYYRNFAHQSPLFVQLHIVQCDNAPDKLDAIWLLPAVEGQNQSYDLISQLSRYLEKMQEFLSS